MSYGLVILLGLLTALEAAAIDMYLPALPSMAAEFNVSPGHVQHTLSVFLAGLAIGQGVYGPLLDRYGRRLPLFAGVVIFILGSAMAAMAPSLEWMLAARFVQALGAAAGLVAPRAIVADTCSLEEASRVFSLLMQVMMLAPILAPLAGGALLEHWSWRSIFWLLAALAAVGLAWGLWSIPDSLPANARLELKAGSIFRAYAAQLRNAPFMAYTLAGGFVLGSLFIYISGSPFVFTENFGLTAAQFSYVFAGNAIFIVAAAVLSNFLLGRGIPPARTASLGIALHTLAGVALVVALLFDAAPFMVFAALLTLAIGSLGLVFGNLTALSMAEGGEQSGVASALMGMTQYLFSALIGYLSALATEGILQVPSAIAVCGICAVIAMWAARRKA